jgi:hypothetical protein
LPVDALQNIFCPSYIVLFIITGLYPPVLGTTPQQSALLGTVVTIAGYGLVIVLLIVPLMLFLRYARRRQSEPEA